MALAAGDGAGFTDTEGLTLVAQDETDLILFDAAMVFETPYRLG